MNSEQQLLGISSGSGKVLENGKALQKYHPCNKLVDFHPSNCLTGVISLILSLSLLHVCIYVDMIMYIIIYMCSRIELKMTETEQSNCIGQSAPFVMQLALRLCFCQMPIASITNGFTETLNCSGGVTRQNPPNPPEREARASKERKKRVVGGKTPLYTIKSAATTWLPKDLRWRESRSYDVLNFLKRWGHSSGHPEGPREI